MGNIQGTFKEHSGNIQGTSREHPGNIQGTFRELSTSVAMLWQILASFDYDGVGTAHFKNGSPRYQYALCLSGLVAVRYSHRWLNSQSLNALGF
jgi:hypothetical protein